MRDFCACVVVVLCTALVVPAYSQDSVNCFLTDFNSKHVTVPPYEDVPAVAASWSVQVVVNPTDTVGRVSKYIFGNAVAVWVGTNQNNPTLVGHLKKLSPTLIRFPGGSWSDIYFWNGNPGDLPTTIPDGANNGQPIALSPQMGPYQSLTPDGYYAMRQELGTQGLITVNYGYARYGLGDNPVARAAHLAADWVRYDNGRTRFWEIGNENGGPWEAGWQIDTTTNKDSQPKIITGELYGRHFRVFADSMRAAAAQIGATIFIGGQVLHYDGTSSWNVADRQWNEGFFREAGGAADFYVMHNYFSANNSTNPQTILTWASDELKRNGDFIRQDIAAKQAASRPIALTEYNMGSSNATAEGSFIKGMHAVVQFCELARQKFGLSARWLVANWQADGMFYNGSTSGIPAWNPRPEFYYAHFAQRFMGDHMVTATVPGSQVISACASTFASGHLAVIVVNKGVGTYVMSLVPNTYAFGDRYYVYSLKGGTDNGSFSQEVYVNDDGPSAPSWGPPIESLDSLKAYAYPTDGTQIKVPLPARSVQFILLEPGSHIITSAEDVPSGSVEQFELMQNFPNPFNPHTTIQYSLREASTVSLRVYDVMGREVASLLNDERRPAGRHEVDFEAENLPSGAYFYTLRTERSKATRVMMLVK
ncbi:MAG: alpha-L-arabinofuranosidase-like protein [Bacteroidetes bacterium]|nr:alpha-L-arabinofuranosidase-like protein [Bacteroidota bacterium]